MPRKKTTKRKRSLWERFKRIVVIWTDLFQEHNLLTYAAAISFQTGVALVAFTLLGIAVAGLSGHTEVWTSQIAPTLEPKVLLPVFSGMSATVDKVFRTDSTGLLAFGSALAVWEISGAIRACMSALSRIYGTQDDRPWWIRFPLSVGIALVVTASLVGAIVLVSFVRVHGGWHVPVLVGRWAGALLLIALAFAMLVRFAPAEKRRGRWVSVGTFLVVAAWIVQSLIFKWYLVSVASYKSATGSLTAVYFLTTYLYVAAIVLLIGIELDELLRKDVQDRRDSPQILEVVRGRF